MMGRVAHRAVVRSRTRRIGQMPRDGDCTGARYQVVLYGQSIWVVSPSLSEVIFSMPRLATPDKRRNLV